MIEYTFEFYNRDICESILYVEVGETELEAIISVFKLEGFTDINEVYYYLNEVLYLNYLSVKSKVLETDREKKIRLFDEMNRLNRQARLSTSDVVICAINDEIDRLYDELKKVGK